MFKSLKDKLKGALGAFTKKVKEEKVEEVEEAPKEKPKKKAKEKPKVTKKKEKKKEAPKEVKEVVTEEPEVVEEEKEEVEEIIEKEEKPKKLGFFKRVTEKVTKVEISESKFDDLFWPLEVALMENNVAIEVIEKIKEDLKENIAGKKVSRKEVDEIVINSLKNSIEGLFDVEGVDLVKKVKSSKKPYVIAFIGINGSGKTTTMAKIAHMLMQNKLSVVFAAADTFRAASMEQLGEHADKLGVKMIKHEYQSDPAAVAFDAVEHAKSKGIDVVMIDTAGRLHSNTNLMEELKKVIRVNEPDLKIFVGESTTGNDCVEQAKNFDEAIGIDVIVLTKADVDEKGGAAISISFVTGKPIIYLGTGQTYDDLTKFDKKVILEQLF